MSNLAFQQSVSVAQIFDFSKLKLQKDSLHNYSVDFTESHSVDKHGCIVKDSKSLLKALNVSPCNLMGLLLDQSSSTDLIKSFIMPSVDRYLLMIYEYQKKISKLSREIQAGDTSYVSSVESGCVVVLRVVYKNDGNKDIGLEKAENKLMSNSVTQLNCADYNVETMVDWKDIRRHETFDDAVKYIHEVAVIQDDKRSYRYSLNCSEGVKHWQESNIYQHQILEHLFLLNLGFNRLNMFLKTYNHEPVTSDVFYQFATLNEYEHHLEKSIRLLQDHELFSFQTISKLFKDTTDFLKLFAEFQNTICSYLKFRLIHHCCPVVSSAISYSHLLENVLRQINTMCRYPIHNVDGKLFYFIENPATAAALYYCKKILQLKARDCIPMIINGYDKLESEGYLMTCSMNDNDRTVEKIMIKDRNNTQYCGFVLPGKTEKFVFSMRTTKQLFESKCICSDNKYRYWICRSCVELMFVTHNGVYCGCGKSKKEDCEFECFSSSHREQSKGFINNVIDGVTNVLWYGTSKAVSKSCSPLTIAHQSPTNINEEKQDSHKALLDAAPAQTAAIISSGLNKEESLFGNSGPQKQQQVATPNAWKNNYNWSSNSSTSHEQANNSQIQSSIPDAGKYNNDLHLKSSQVHEHDSNPQHEPPNAKDKQCELQARHSTAVKNGKVRETVIEFERKSSNGIPSHAPLLLKTGEKCENRFQPDSKTAPVETLNHNNQPAGNNKFNQPQFEKKPEVPLKKDSKANEAQKKDVNKIDCSITVDWNATQSVNAENGCSTGDGPVNILLVGKMGVGKSTLLNAFNVYLKHKTPVEARGQPLECTLPVKFNVFNEDYSETVVEVPADDDNEIFHDLMDTNKQTTQRCKSHSYKYNDRTINFIDTPGITATNRNQVVQDIKDQIMSLTDIHGICFVMKPNESKLDQQMENVMKEFILFFPRSILDKVFFFMTHSMSTFFGPGDSMQPLKLLANKLKESNKIELPLKKENIFCFDNEAFRFLCAEFKSIDYSILTKDDYSLTWTESRTSMFRFMNAVLKKKSADIRDIDQKQLLKDVISPLADFSYSVKYKNFPFSLKSDLKRGYYLLLKKLVELETDHFAADTFNKMNPVNVEKILTAGGINNQFVINDKALLTAVQLFQKYFKATTELETYEKWLQQSQMFLKF